MEKKMDFSKKALTKAINMLNLSSENLLHQQKIRDLSIKIQFSLNSLIQNEKKIWLRTKIGKEMIDEFNSSVEKLIKIVDGSRSDFLNVTELEVLNNAVEEVKNIGKKMNEETRKRNMVVT
jgi:pyruvate formate-lyase activating enzyme-like uncharacterized protein